MNRREIVLSGMAAMAVGSLRLPSELFRPAPVLPSAQQLAWQNAAMGMFIHFGVNTWSDREWGLGNEDPASFNPVALDARQWVRGAQAAGCKYIVLTAKHHDGFCLWPTRTTNHSVTSSPWKGGNGDVVRELADAARAGGIGLGLYLSPWDRNAASYGTGAAYMDLYIAQLTELLTGYGPVMEVWFDGANGEGPNGRKQTYDWPRIHSTVRRLQPDAVMFSDSGPDIRWIGNERGRAGDPNWCTVDPSIVTEPGMDGPHIIAALQHGNPPPAGTVWRPGEAPVSIRPGWFYHAAEDDRVKPADQLMQLWMDCVGRNANLLLNVPPNREGLLSDADIRALGMFGIRQRDMWAGAIEPRLAAPSPEIVELDLDGTTRVGAVALHEAIAEGQRIAKYRVEALTETGWARVTNGTTIGHMKVDRLTPVVASKMRVVVEEAIAPPKLQRVRVALA